MENPKIQPEKITKPIQLLAVWFAGLVLLVGLLLAGAKTITQPLWLVPVLVISAILIIPLFLYFVFLLQTKYRPQMQEDTYYSKYLDTSTNRTIDFNQDSNVNSSVIELQKHIIQLTESNKNYINKIELLIKDSKSQDLKKISEIKEYIKSTNENFNKVEESIKKSQFVITLNRLLPNFSKVRLEIIKNGFENIGEFTGGGKKQLEKFLISVGSNVEPEFVCDLIKVLHPLGLELISLIDSGHEKEMHKNEIIVGSHAYSMSGRVLLNIDPVFIETISNIENKELFQKMFK